MDFLYCSDVDIYGFLPTKIGRFRKQIEDELEMSSQTLFIKRKKNLLRLLAGEGLKIN